jgi:hypothetical protein
MFVPPWNRIHPDHIAALGPLGFDKLSTFGPRKAACAGQGVAVVNTHIDPIDWRGTRDLIAADTLIAQTAALLEDRLAGHIDAAEPLGYLSHHLVHSQAIWSFSRQWADEMLQGGATPWLPEKES